MQKLLYKIKSQAILICLAFFSLFIFSTVSGQILTPVKWSFNDKVNESSETVLQFSAKIDKGWYVYSQYLEEGGPIPTEVVFETLEGVELIGKTTEKGKIKKGFDEMFEMEVGKYANKLLLEQKIKLTGNTGKISGYVTYMTCDDEQCLPPDDTEFSFNLVKKETPVQETPEPVNEEPKVEETKTVVPAKETTKEVVAETKEIIEQKVKTEEIDAEESVEAISLPENGEFENPVKWSIDSKETESGFEVIFNADIEDKWNIYSSTMEEGGPIPTSFTFESDTTFNNQIEETAKLKSDFDELFEMEVSKIYNNSSYKITFPKGTKEVKGYLTFMTCKEVCLPPEDLYFTINSEKGTALFDEISDDNAVEVDMGENTPKFPIYDGCGDAHSSDDATGNNLWIIFILGFGGGLLALLTPCVFPMIPLTVSFFTKRSKDKKKGIINAFIYAFFIIFIYVGLGLFITITLGADILNQMASNGIVNMAFFIIFIVFAISFFGVFDITLPNSLINKADSASDKGGLIGIFFMAFTLALVSFSCTGPIIGTLLVEAAVGGSRLGPMMGMLGFATALALPFALFAAFPGWLNSLPKSGGWLNTVKVSLGFLELALALKFLSVVDMAYHWNFLKIELFLALWILIFFAWGLYLFGIIKFPHDNPNEKIGWVRKGLGTACLAFVAYLTFGLVTYTPLTLLSGLSPPVHYSYFRQNDCPHNLDCYKDYEEGMAAAKAQNKAVLLDFTGFTCTNCRKMEETVWNKPEILDLIANDFVLISLYVDDKNGLPESEKYVSEFTGKKVRTVGNKWADFEAKYFNKVSQPYYVLLAPDGQVLNTPVAYTPDVQEYKAFLECGLNAFENYK